jgi:hypothetical protein
MKYFNLIIKLLIEFLLIISACLAANHAIFVISTPDSNNHFTSFQDPDYALGFLTVNGSPLWYFITVVLSGINLVEYFYLVSAVAYLYYKQICQLFENSNVLKFLFVIQALFYQLNMSIMVVSAVRQSLAMLLLMYAYNNRGRFSLFVIYALVFLSLITHPFVSGFFVFIYLIFNFKFFSKKYFFLVFLFVLFAVYIFNDTVYIFNDIVQAKFYDYVANESHDNFFEKILISALFVLFTGMYLRLVRTIHHDYKILLSLLIISAFFDILVMLLIPSIGVRVFNILYIIYLPVFLHIARGLIRSICR